jgi:hypothetical protein
MGMVGLSLLGIENFLGQQTASLGQTFLTLLKRTGRVLHMGMEFGFQLTLVILELTDPDVVIHLITVTVGKKALA